MTAPTLPTVHTAANPGPIGLQPVPEQARLPRGLRVRDYEPHTPYLIHLPGAGIVRLGRVTVDDYRQPGDRSMDRVRIGYVLHRQTKALRDHGGHRSEYAEFYIAGARRLRGEAFEDRLADAVRGIIADRDRAADEAVARAAAARALRDDLTARGGALGVTVEWADDAHPVLTAALLGLILTTAEEASRDDGPA